MPKSQVHMIVSSALSSFNLPSGIRMHSFSLRSSRYHWLIAFCICQFLFARSNLADVLCALSPCECVRVELHLQVCEARTADDATQCGKVETPLKFLSLC